MLLEVKRRLIIVNKKVACPIRGDCDVERCLSCPYLDTGNLDASDPWIRCRVPREDSPMSAFNLHIIG